MGHIGSSVNDVTKPAVAERFSLNADTHVVSCTFVYRHLFG